MKILLFGSGGQLGWELQRTCPPNVELVTCNTPKVDFLNHDSIEHCIRQSRPEVIINAAAYTAVDQAETQQDTAFQINYQAVEEIAQLCRKNSIFLVHVSTDFVFSGIHHKPYTPEDMPDPISIYGHSKLKGELAIRSILKDQPLIIRTAWLYSAHGQNFVKNMIRLMNEQPKLGIVDEQLGTPTWAKGLALSIWGAIETKLTGIYHWTDAGVASWYDFAVAIQEEGLRIGLIQQEIPITPIAAEQYPTPAQRPFYSVLDKRSFWQALNCQPVHWRAQLRSMLKELL